MKSVVLERRGTAAWVVMNRPEALNAFDDEMNRAMLDRLAEVGADPAIRVVVLAGAGRSFCTGVDVKALGDRGLTTDFFRDWQRITDALEALDVPLVIAARGHCLGGGLMLLLAGDMRIAGDDLQTGLGAVRHGIVPGSGTYRLAEAVGAPAARRLCLFAEYVGADEALRLGLVDRVVAAADVDAAARAAAERVAGFSPLAVRETKRLLRRAASEELEVVKRAYLEAQQRCLDSGEVKPWRK